MLQRTRWTAGSLLRDAFLSLFLFVWMYQLLAPLGKIGGVPNMKAFYLFVGGLLIIDLFVRQFAFKFFVKMAVVFLMLYFFYGAHTDFWAFEWLKNVAGLIEQGLSMVLQKQYLHINEVTRTFLFMMFLWLTVSVYRNAIGSRIWLFILLLIGEVVIGIIDTYFPPDSSQYVVRYFLFGFLLLALSQLPELEKWARISEKLRGWSAKWVLWTVVITLAAVGTGVAAPKYPPAWPDPVAFLQGKDPNGSTKGPKKIGYGTNDAQLGGAFEQDETVAFTVITNQQGYYRGESKSFYTGKGWLPSGNNYPLNTMGSNILQESYVKNNYGIIDGVKTKKVEQDFQIQHGKFDVMLAQYPLSQIVSTKQNESKNPMFNMDGWKIVDLLQAGDTYKVVSEVPYFDEKGFIDREKNLPAMQVLVDQQYREIPDNFPMRVRQLALQITAGKTSSYEKAQAIEAYLRTNYQYQTQDIPYPADGQDFVDQFLFESKEGYCDHFSSAMVMMARSVGLSARWVKGFTSGDMDLSVSLPNKDMTEYIVRNKNAHSWPEIFVPGTGWMAFEPTATFIQPKMQEESKPALENTPLPVSKDHKDDRQEQDVTANSNSGFDRTVIWVIAVWLLAILLVVAFVFRRRLLIAYYIRRSMGKGETDKSTILKAIERLLTALQRFGLRREPDITVREFGAEMTNKGYRGNEWILLSRIFERAFYGNKALPTKEFGEFKNLWERIIRKIGRTNNR